MDPGHAQELDTIKSSDSSHQLTTQAEGYDWLVTVHMVADLEAAVPHHRS